MRLQYQHDQSAKPAVFCSVEQQDTTETIALSNIMVWALTDNSAVAGIMANTMGYRVIKMPATANLMNVAGIASSLPYKNGTTANLAVAARVAPFEIQVYGWCQLTVDTANNSTGPFAIATAGTANTVQDCVIADVSAASIGFCFTTQTAAAGAQTLDCFLRLM